MSYNPCFIYLMPTFILILHTYAQFAIATNDCGTDEVSPMALAVWNIFIQNNHKPTVSVINSEACVTNILRAIRTALCRYPLFDKTIHKKRYLGNGQGGFY